MNRPVILVAVALVASSCATTNREQEREIAELRAQVERLKAEKAQAEAELAKALEREMQPSPAAAATLYRQALALEAEGRGADAVKLYERAVKYGSGKAALRLGEIYDKGIPGVPRDFVQSLMYYNAARQLGENVVLAGPRETLPSFEQAQALERDGKGAEAVKAYLRLARSGHGKAAKRLGEIYEIGIPGVERNLDESLKWYNAARVLGEDVPSTKRLTM